MKKIIGFIFNADNVFSRIICSLVYIVVYDLAFNGFVFKLFHYMGIDYIPNASNDLSDMGCNINLPHLVL